MSVEAVKVRGENFKRYVRSERMANAKAYFSNGWTLDELREKASSMAIRMLALDAVLTKKYGDSVLVPTFTEQLEQLSRSFLPQVIEGHKPRRLMKQKEQADESC